MRKPVSVLIAASAAIAIVPASGQSPRSITAPPPPATAVQPAEPAPDMQAVLDARAPLGGEPIEMLASGEARLRPRLREVSVR